LLNTNHYRILYAEILNCMKYDLLLAELIVAKSQARTEVSQTTENQESNKSWLERFFDFLTPNDFHIATR
jgi:hypothetical protein